MQQLFWVIYQNQKRCLGLAIGAPFLHNIFKKRFLNNLHIDKVSMSRVFPSQDIKQKVLVCSYLDYRRRQNL